MNSRSVFMGIAGALTLVLVAGCGSGFSASCKDAINRTIDLRSETDSLSGYSPAPCDMKTSDEEKGPQLAAACAQLETAVSDLNTMCVDDVQGALEAALKRERQ